MEEWLLEQTQMVKTDVPLTWAAVTVIKALFPRLGGKWTNLVTFGVSVGVVASAGLAWQAAPDIRANIIRVLAIFLLATGLDKALVKRFTPKE